jgi:hypothetical protein
MKRQLFLGTKRTLSETFDQAQELEAADSGRHGLHGPATNDEGVLKESVPTKGTMIFPTA